LTLRFGLSQPEWIGVGASLGTLAGFAALFSLVMANRRRWLTQK
jgi:hypothetical protein